MKQLSVCEQLTNADHLICPIRAQKRKQNQTIRVLLPFVMYHFLYTDKSVKHPITTRLQINHLIHDLLILLRSLSEGACTPPDTSKSTPTAYCFLQLKQSTYLI